jgi:hypothetical protein
MTEKQLRNKFEDDKKTEGKGDERQSKKNLQVKQVKKCLRKLEKVKILVVLSEKDRET